MAGSVELTGEAAPTRAVGFEAAVADPAVFDAVTATTSVEPTSFELAVYVALVAPAIGEHDPPPLLQRFH
jgi:hypothetical protein